MHPARLLGIPLTLKCRRLFRRFARDAGDPRATQERVLLEKLRRNVMINNSLYEIVKNEFQTNITWGEASLLPAKADKMAAERLNVARGTLLMRVEQTDYDITNRPIMHSVEYHVLDPFVFKVHRKGPHL